MFKKTSIIPH